MQTLIGTVQLGLFLNRRVSSEIKWIKEKKLKTEKYHQLASHFPSARKSSMISLAFSRKAT